MQFILQQSTVLGLSKASSHFPSHLQHKKDTVDGEQMCLPQGVGIFSSGVGTAQPSESL